MKCIKLCILFFLSMVLSCNLINLQPLDMDLFPSENDQVIGINQSVVVRFSESPVRETVERSFSLKDTRGTVLGDFTWSGNSVSYFPHDGWRMAEPYLLEIKGEIHTDGDLEFSVNEKVSFYVGQRDGVPILTESVPADEASIDVGTDLILRFNQAMDTTSFRRNFSILPSIEYRETWSPDNREVTISPVNQWVVNERYQWKLLDTWTSAEGIYLPRSFEGHFVSDLDNVFDLTAPGIVLAPAVYNVSTGAVTIPGNPLNDIVYGQDILFTFREAIDFSSMVSAFSSDPSISGELIPIDGENVILRILEPLTPQAHYKITLSTALKDAPGNPLLEDQIFEFDCLLIPYQEIPSISTGGGLDLVAIHPWAGVAPNLPIINLTDNASMLSQFITLNLAEPISNPAKRLQFVQNDISLSPILGTSSTPKLILVDWENSNTVHLHYENFEYSTDHVTFQNNYFRLTVKGGVNTTSNDSGAYLKEDLIVDFITEEAPP